MRQLSLAAYVYLALMGVAMAVGLVQIVNNTVGPNGYLLDNSGGFLLDNVNPANGKIFAR